MQTSIYMVYCIVCVRFSVLQKHHFQQKQLPAKCSTLTYNQEVQLTRWVNNKLIRVIKATVKPRQLIHSHKAIALADYCVLTIIKH